MRILFVFPDLSSTITHYTGVVSYGVGALTAALRGAGHEVGLIHLVDPPVEAGFRARVRAFAPDLVAFSSNSHYARRLRDWTAWAREASGAPVVVGGVHATLAPEAVAAIPHVDFTCVGEGEGALVELCAALERGGDPRGIANLWVRDGDAIVRNPSRALIGDLDALPDPDLSGFDFERLYGPRRGTFTFCMSRGCAWGCTYCCVHALRRVARGRGRYWRFLSPERAARQLRALLDRHMPDAEMVTFVDAVLFPDREWLAGFAPLYRRTIGLPFSCNLRADMIDEEIAATLRTMGCRVVRMGVESGDERITREVLRRSLDVADLRRAFALLRAQGIERWSYNMVGLPGETLREALSTVRFNAEIAPEVVLAFIFFPYPGTELQAICERNGWLTGAEFDHYQAGSAVRMPQFSETDIRFVQRWFQRLVRLHAAAARLPGPLGRAAPRLLDGLLESPWFPRAALLHGREGYRALRHRVGETLVRRSPALYRALGGRDPVGRGAPPLAGSHG